MISQNWVMIISEQHRYQGVSYKSDIIVISGLDLGDRQALEHKYAAADPPCLMDSSDGRFVLKGVNYNPLDVMNVLMMRRGYKVEGDPQQRTLPSIHNKDDNYILENAHNLRTSSTRVTKELAKSLIRKDSDLSNYHQKFAIIYHMSKDVPRSRVDSISVPELTPRSYSVGSSTKKMGNVGSLTKQSKSKEDAVTGSTPSGKKIGYHPALSERTGKKIVQRAMSLAQKK